ncbi:hypothetical protein F5Y10DRAFT_284227 [Nemania abortiva]|nr:hypothetical protein F5Y10DRAFT_284227 [Nemania abortiva]
MDGSADRPSGATTHRDSDSNSSSSSDGATVDYRNLPSPGDRDTCHSQSPTKSLPEREVPSDLLFDQSSDKASDDSHSSSVSSGYSQPNCSPKYPVRSNFPKLLIPPREQQYVGENVGVVIHGLPHSCHYPLLFNALKGTGKIYSCIIHKDNPHSCAWTVVHF